MSDRAQSILEQRAELLARKAETRVKRALVATVAVVRIGAGRFGFPVDRLREIVPRTRELALPGVPPWIVGVAQIRHEVVSVVDLTRQLDPRGLGQADYLVVVEGKDGALAVLANEVIGLRRVYADELAPGLLESERLSALPVQAVTKDLTTMVDAEHLLRIVAMTEPEGADTVASTPAGAPASEDE